MRINWIVVVLALFCLNTGPTFGKLSNQELAPILKEYNQAMRIKDYYAVGEAMKRMAKDNSVRIAKVILKTTLRHNDKHINKACIESLRQINNPKAIRFLAKNLKNRDVRVPILILEAMETTRTDEVTETYVDMLDKSRYSAVLLTCIRILGKRRDMKAVPGLIDFLKKIDKKGEGGTLAYETRLALTTITKKDYPNGKEWEKWWKVYKVNKGEATRGRTVLRQDIKKTGPRLFSETIVSNKVIFVLDISASMVEKDPFTGEGKGTTMRHKPGTPLPASRMRINRAKAQLINVIKALPSHAKFNVIAFNSKTYPWKSNVRRASSSNKGSAISFVMNLKARKMTATSHALKTAFRNKDFDTLYLLSDGEPTVGPSPQAILTWVYQNNRFRKIKIHTLGFPGVNRSFMGRLSRQNFGKYTDIR